ncbi:hypothetical protein SK128_027690 [Halocaridina rubra]|uniref:Protein phosphatase 1 regulatory subunit 35 C-terminal domain-containing protein n=1 Tax=Halocaridina rubra TaxID=373956 RepID=A0AAN8ZZZ1_HALRR
MATSNNTNKFTQRSERHIRFDVETDEDRLTRKKSTKAHPHVQPALTNLQTKNIPTCTTVKKELKNYSDHPRRGKTAREIDTGLSAPLPESAEEVYGAPELHSTIRIGQALVKAKNKKPDLHQLVEDKLHSPNTGARVKTEVSKKVGVPTSKNVFRDLVSVEVSQDALTRQLEEQLQVRASVVRPPPQVQDSEPQLSDYLNPEDYVTSARVTTAKVYLPFSSVKPQTVKREDYLKLAEYFLGSSYRTGS